MEASARAPGIVLRSTGFDAEMSIKVECVDVKLPYDGCICRAFKGLQTRLLSANRQLFAIRNKPLAGPRILLPGVEKAPWAGLRIKSEPARSFYAASKVISFDTVRKIA